MCMVLCMIVRRNVSLPDDIDKEMKSAGINVSEFLKKSWESAKTLNPNNPIPNGKIDWSKVKENEFDTCLYLVRLDGLSDYERLSRRDFRTPESSAQYYNALRLSLIDARGRSRIDVENRIDSLLQFIKNGVKFAYLRRDFIERFEKCI